MDRLSLSVQFLSKIGQMVNLCPFAANTDEGSCQASSRMHEERSEGGRVTSGGYRVAQDTNEVQCVETE